MILELLLLIALFSLLIPGIVLLVIISSMVQMRRCRSEMYAAPYYWKDKSEASSH